MTTTDSPRRANDQVRFGFLGLNMAERRSLWSALLIALFTSASEHHSMWNLFILVVCGIPAAVLVRRFGAKGTE